MSTPDLQEIIIGRWQRVVDHENSGMEMPTEHYVALAKQTLTLLKAQEELCEHCGLPALIDDCMRCGAPVCCSHCCEIDTLKALLKAQEEQIEKVLILLEGCNLTYSRLSTVARIEECIRTLAPPRTEDKRMSEQDRELSGSEAVYGFAAWLTCREQKIVAGATEDAASWADLVDEFVTCNGLKPPREDWTNYLHHPQQTEDRE